MKYIRTKDGTIELNREEIEREITKEADTIEELCDEYVGVYENICEVVIDRINWNKYDTFYGAIWTEWGLKYVAKMNKKGELELL